MFVGFAENGVQSHSLPAALSDSALAEHGSWMSNSLLPAEADLKDRPFCAMIWPSVGSEMAELHANLVPDQMRQPRSVEDIVTSPWSLNHGPSLRRLCPINEKQGMTNYRLPTVHNFKRICFLGVEGLPSQAMSAALESVEEPFLRCPHISMAEKEQVVVGLSFRCRRHLLVRSKESRTEASAYSLPNCRVASLDRAAL